MKKSKWADSDDEKEKELRKKLKREPSKSEDSEAAWLSSRMPSNSTEDAAIATPVPPVEEAIPEENKQEKGSQAFKGPKLQSCRIVTNFEKLNRIDEGSFGVVYRGKDKETGEIVALKKLKLNADKSNGFSIVFIREIHTLLWMKHPNIVDLKEVVVTKDLYK